MTVPEISRQGLFIVIEGADGTGSTTQARLLAERLRRLGALEVALTCEPTAGPIGSMIRQVLSHRLVVPHASGERAPHWTTMALLFAADRCDHVDCLIKPVLKGGGVVVSDRYVLSSLTYQSATSEEGEASLPWLRSINSAALQPDLTIVLTLSAESAAERRAVRGDVEELYEQEPLQRRLTQLYSQAAHLLPGQRVALVDAAGSIDEVAALVWEQVSQVAPALLIAQSD